MRALFSKALYLAAIGYVISLPLAFFVSGFLHARPLRAPIGIDDLSAALGPGQNTRIMQGSQEIKIKIDRNQRLAATVFGGDSSSTVIVMHEHGANRIAGLNAAYALWTKGLDVVLIDRFAHGNSDGETRPLFGGEEEEIRAVVDQLIKNDWCGTGRIGLFGIKDAGTAALIAAASDDRIDAVAAEDPSLNAIDLVSVQLSSWCGFPSTLLFPQSFLTVQGMKIFGGVTDDDLDAKERIQGIEAPIMILSSGDSDLRPLAIAVQQALVGANLSTGSTREDDYSELASFFKQNL